MNSTNQLNSQSLPPLPPLPNGNSTTVTSNDAGFVPPAQIPANEKYLTQYYGVSLPKESRARILKGEKLSSSDIGNPIPVPRIIPIDELLGIKPSNPSPLSADSVKENDKSGENHLIQNTKSKNQKRRIAIIIVILFIILMIVLFINLTLISQLNS